MVAFVAYLAFVVLFDCFVDFGHSWGTLTLELGCYLDGCLASLAFSCSVFAYQTWDC